MEIWLKQNRAKLRLPVLPSGYSVTSAQNNTSLNVNSLGEILLLGKRGLQSVNLSSFFPNRYDSSYCEYRNIDSPKEYVEQIEKMKRNGVINFTITGALVPRKMVIESFEWEEKDGTGDISYTLSLKEYRKPNIPVSVLQTEAVPQPAEETRTQPEHKQTVTYTVKSGDCLSTIARKTTGSANWQSIYQQNKDIIGSNPNRIKPGQVLTIPEAKV